MLIRASSGLMWADGDDEVAEYLPTHDKNTGTILQYLHTFTRLKLYSTKFDLIVLNRSK